MKKIIFLNSTHSKMFFNKKPYKIFFDGIIINSHEYLERFNHDTLSRYSHKAINSGVKIHKKEGD